MAVSLAKACKSYQAVTMLCRSRYGEDAAILNRSLLSLSTNAHWIDQNPDQRVSAYVDYNHVLEARYNRKIVENPGPLGHSQYLVPGRRIQQAELDLLSKQAKERHGYNRHGWSGKWLRDMAVELGMTNDYDSGYTLTSELEHSSVGSLDEYASLSSQGAFQVSGGPSPNWALESIGFEHLSLIKVTELADRILDLGITADLNALDAEALGLFGAQRLPTRIQKE
jgi:hypothetical protein